MQVFNVAIKHFLDGFGVVEHAVVGGLREREHARLDSLRVYAFEQRVGADFGADFGWLKLAFWYGADDAVVVARGLQEDGNCARHDDAVQDGFVAVAVNYHHVARGYGVVPHDFVAGAGAVGDEKAVVGIEYAGGVALALANSAVVVKQLAELFYGIAHVGAQHVFAVKLVVHLPDGAFEERHAARVPGAVP